MPGLTVKDLEKLQLLHPDYRMELVGGEKEVLRDGDVLTVPELLAGWELAVAEVWAPEFD